ncbi:hypothetical protein C5167_043130 [Papaver somniferum]|uniref:Ubiquitin-like protease family profile domain-containing protein n=1 Tax=Papaver somniferum TaxID=3469 RepID=A0A4Y7L6J3_PAPSO|nr:hypothetical protein C5167_043130 [Papaver somniferum]
MTPYSINGCSFYLLLWIFEQMKGINRKDNSDSWPSWSQEEKQLCLFGVEEENTDEDDVSKLKNELAEKDKIIRHLNDELEARNTELEAKEAESEAKDKKISYLQSEVEALKAQLKPQPGTQQDSSQEIVLYTTPKDYFNLNITQEMNKPVEEDVPKDDITQEMNKPVEEAENIPEAEPITPVPRAEPLAPVPASEINQEEIIAAEPLAVIGSLENRVKNVYKRARNNKFVSDDDERAEKKQKDDKLRKLTRNNKLWKNYLMSGIRQAEEKLIKEYFVTGKVSDCVWKSNGGVCISGEHIQQLVFNQPLVNTILEFKIENWRQLFQYGGDTKGYSKSIFLSALAWADVIEGDELDDAKMINAELQKIDVETQYLFIPMLNEKEHFTLLHLDIHGRTWTHYNSRLGSSNYLKEAQMMAERINHLFQVQIQSTSMDDVDVVVQSDCPQQCESDDSMMYVIYYMEWAMIDGYSFEGKDTIGEEMGTRRINLAYEILTDENSCWKV